MQSPAGFIKQAKGFLLGELWQSDREPSNPLVRAGHNMIRLLLAMIRELSNGQLNLRAMSLVYTTLLSLVPLLAVSFSVLMAFGVHNQIEPLLLSLVDPLGEKGDELVANILGFVENMKVGVLGSLGLAFLLYTVLSLIQKIEAALNYVWQAKAPRSLGRRFSDYLSVIMVGPVLVFSAIGITASMMSTNVMQAILDIEPFGTLLVLLGMLAPFALVVVAFCFIYMFVPNTRVKFKSALVGAVVGGGLWQLSGLAFAQFAASSTRYAAIYSGFAILVFFMIWLYLSWLILLLGAQVAFYHQHPEQISLSNQRLPLNGRLREQMTLTVMYWIAHRFVSDGPPLSLEALSQKLQAPGERVAEILDLLQSRGLVVESGNDPPEYLLQHDPAQLSMAELLEIIRRPDKEQTLMGARVHSVTAISSVMERLELGTHQQLGGLSLRELVLGEEGKVPALSKGPGAAD